MKTLILTIVFSLAHIWSLSLAQELISSILPDSHKLITNLRGSDQMNRDNSHPDRSRLNNSAIDTHVVKIKNDNSTHRKVTCKVRADNGFVYTGTKDGILLWDNYSNIRITTDNSNISQNHITALALDYQDHLWIGTYNAGIVLGIGDPIKPFKTKPIETHDKDIYFIYTDAGLVWVYYRNLGKECFRNGISCGYFPRK